MINQRLHHRRGIAIVYFLLIFTVLLGFVAFAVDWARVQLVKTELQRAADAAARFAAVGVATSTAQAQTNAIAVASENLADGTSVALAASDVTPGSWDPDSKTFTANGSPLNAVQVIAGRTSAKGNAIRLYFARAVGFSTIDVNARAIAYLAPSGVNFHVIAIDGINMNGNNRIDAFNSSLGTYAGTVNDDGRVASNFNFLNMVGGAVIDADAFYTAASAPGGNITGTKTKVDTLGTFPIATTPAGATDHGNYNGGNLTLNSGNHYFQSFSAGGNTTITINASAGPVRIYCNGNFSLSGNAAFAYTQPAKAANLEIHMQSGSGIDPGKNDVYAIIDAPNSPLNMNGNADIYGIVLVKQISMAGGCGIHADLAAPGMGGTTGTSGVSLTR